MSKRVAAANEGREGEDRNELEEADIVQPERLASIWGIQARGGN